MTPARAATHVCDLDLAPEVGEVRRARLQVAAHLAALGLHNAAEILGLVVSELVANAVAHAETPTRLRLAHDDRGLMLEVADTTVPPPQPCCCDGEDEHGRGLALVDALADDWGWRPDASGGKITWARLDVPTPAP